MHDENRPLEKAERRRIESELFLIGNHLRKRRETKEALEYDLRILDQKEKRLAVDKKRMEAELRSVLDDLRSKEGEERSLKRRLQTRSL